MSSSHDEAVWVETQNSAEFKELRKKFRNFAFPVTVAFLAWYFAYVLLTALAGVWVSGVVGPSIIFAVVLGVLQFASTFLIMWLYERHSSKTLDAASDALRDKVNGKLGK